MQGCVLLVLFCAWQVKAVTRTFYLAAVEEDWDYAPNGNLVNNDNSSALYLAQGPNRIGSMYRKILYRQFTDVRFTRMVPRDESQGLVGPLLRAETGDTMEIFFKNMVTSVNRNFSIHPHGVLYSKNSEGALYVDQTTGSDKADDGVAPGRVFKYVWHASPSFAPTVDDERCLPWAYHSHVAATRDVDSGLVGLLLICKQGTLYRSGPNKDKRRDVSREFMVYFDTTDENESWLMDRNLNRCGNSTKCRQLSQTKDSAFVASNRMSHVNGRVYGNLKGLEVRRGESVMWYLFSINRGITSVHFSGQQLTVKNHRVDSVTLFPASFISALMVPYYAGNWLMASRNVDTYLAGQQAFLRVKSNLPSYGRKRRQAPNDQSDKSIVSQDLFNLAGIEDPELSRQSISSQYQGTSQTFGVKWTRKYYIAVERYIWDYGPSGQNLYDGGSLASPGSPSALYFTRGPKQIGGKYFKVRYQEYTDYTFRTRKSRDSSEEHLGMLGPVIMMEVAESVEVHLKNNADRPYSFLPHGVLFSKENEGFVYKDPDSRQLEGQVVQPGDIVTYRFFAPLLTRDDPPCVTYSYHSAVDPVRDVNSGLVGPLIVCKRGELQKQVLMPWGLNLYHQSSLLQRKSWFLSHQHLFLNFFTVDENWSWYLQENIRNFTINPSSEILSDPDFKNSNRRHAINGRMFGNLEGLKICRYDDVAWHVFGVGGEFDMHGVNFQGQTLEVAGTHINAKVIIPGSAVTLTSVPDSIGNWSVACRTNFHFLTGMTAKYEVQACNTTPQPPLPASTTRRYFVAAQEVQWNYAPLQRDPVTGENLTDESLAGYLYVRHDAGFIGSVYKKAIYVEYTDATFTAIKPRGPSEKHLGILGPVIKAEVGDVIEVVFFNNASRPYSIHPQGVKYSKNSEGAKYEDGAATSDGDSVAPGRTYTYRWEVPERAGPGVKDPKCIAWMYYSSVNSVKDMNSGLVGPLIVCEQNTLNTVAGNARLDVDREFWMLYTIFDENLSWYFQDNVQQRAPDRKILTDPLFVQSNQMNAINGLIYGNVQGLVMSEGDVVAWYLMGLGSSLDYHPVHFHGQTFIHRSEHTRRGDVMEVFPSTSTAVEMLCDNPGTWVIHCHFSSHIAGGMEALYTILPAGSS